jgi:hypothetical protein
MCTRDKDIYSCGCTKKEYPLKEYPHKRWGRPCPYDILVNKYQETYPCAYCRRIRPLESHVGVLEDDIIRLRSQNGSRYRDRMRSEIGDLEKRRRGEESGLRYNDVEPKSELPQYV